MLAPAGVQELARLALEAADLPQYLVDLLALVLELRAAGGKRGDDLRELRPLVRRRIVELQHLADLGEGEAEPLAAQYQLQAYPVALGIDAPRAVARGAEQAFVLVETDGAMSHVELACKLGDAVGFGGLIHRRDARARADGFVAGSAIICENSQLSPREASDSTPTSSRHPKRMSPESILEYPHAAPPAPGDTLQVAPGVHWLRMPLPFALDHINLWLLEDESDGNAGWTIIDCGIGDDVTRALWERIFATRIAGRPVRRLIVTHHHPDHAGLASWLTERTGAEFWMPQAEYFAAHAMREGSAGFGFDNVMAMFVRNGLAGEQLTLMQQRRTKYRSRVPGFPSGYRRLMGGEGRRIAGRAWSGILGYGHAPEHAALYCEELGVLISGDMVLPRISTNVSVWASEPEENPLALCLDSLSRYAELPETTCTLPSHGLPFRGLRERIAQLKEHHRLRLAELHEACDTPKAAADVLDTLFRRKLDTHQLFFAMGEAMAHLHLLHFEGRLERSVGADGVVRYAQS